MVKSDDEIDNKTLIAQQVMPEKLIKQWPWYSTMDDKMTKQSKEIRRQPKRNIMTTEYNMKHWGDKQDITHYSFKSSRTQNKNFIINSLVVRRLRKRCRRTLDGLANSSAWQFQKDAYTVWCNPPSFSPAPVLPPCPTDRPSPSETGPWRTREGAAAIASTAEDRERQERCLPSSLLEILDAAGQYLSSESSPHLLQWRGHVCELWRLLLHIVSCHSTRRDLHAGKGRPEGWILLWCCSSD